MHDHFFLRKDGKTYSNTFSSEVLRRYTDVFSEVTVVARYRNTDDIGSVPVSDGKDIGFVLLESISSPSSYLYLRRQYEKMIKKLIEEHEAIIVRLPSELGLMTAKIAQNMKRKYLVEVAGCGWDAMVHYGGWQSKLYAPVLFFKMKKAVKKASFVSYVTKHFLQERYPASEDAETISVSNVMLPSMRDNVLAKRIAKIERVDRKIVFGTIANLDVKYKGIDTAIKALASVVPVNSEIEYRILGSGDPAPFEELAEGLGLKERVYFDGRKSGDQAIFGWLDDIDIYLQPSYQEGLPRALIEAMSRGCPAIGSSAGGIPELLSRDKVFPRGDAVQLEKTLKILMADRRAMSDAAKENFLRARQYQKDLIEPRRERFMSAYRDKYFRIKR